MKIGGLTILLIVVIFFTACGPSKVEDGKIDVVTTVGMLADVVKNVGGDLVTVESLMGPGVDPHLYKSSAGDIATLENADLVFLVGLHLEGKMVDIFESLAATQNIVAVGEFIDKSVLLDAGESMSGTYDPHIWFDVGIWLQVVSIVEENLILIDPDNAKSYEANADAYLKELEALDLWVAEEISHIPEEKRVLITAHDAFGYFGKAYDVEVRGVLGISTSSDFGLKDLESIINLIVERKIRSVFVESSVSPKSIEALREGVDAKGWNVEIGGKLYSDAMGDYDTFEGTYVGMVKHNVSVIVNSLK
jgi:manganese/zinc/iron transport system substrate-binding protein